MSKPQFTLYIPGPSTNLLVSAATQGGDLTDSLAEVWVRDDAKPLGVFGKLKALALKVNSAGKPMTWVASQRCFKLKLNGRTITVDRETGKLDFDKKEGVALTFFYNTENVNRRSA